MYFAISTQGVASADSKRADLPITGAALLFRNCESCACSMSHGIQRRIICDLKPALQKCCSMRRSYLGFTFLGNII